MLFEFECIESRLVELSRLDCWLLLVLLLFCVAWIFEGCSEEIVVVEDVCGVLLVVWVMAG